MQPEQIQNAPPSWWAINCRSGSRSAEVSIYGDIGESWSDETVTARAFVAEIAKLQVDSLLVRINSTGGSVPDALAIYNALRRHPAAVVSRVEGVAASCASMIAMAGDVVEMAENAILMIHAPWSGVAGNARDLREMADTLDRFAASMATSYVRPKTKDSPGLTYDEALALLTDGADHWYSASEAMGAGLVDRITEAQRIAAAVDMHRYQIPPRLRPAASIPLAKKESAMNPEEIQAAALAAKPAPQETVAPAAAMIQIDEIKAEALRDDAQRRQNIEAIASPWLQGEGARTDVRELVKAASNSGQSVEAFRRDFLILLGKNNPGIGGGVLFTVEDETDKFRAGVTSGLLIKAGLSANDTGNEFRSYSLIEIARACLQRRNISMRGMEKMQVVGAAFTHSSSDFTDLLADVSNKAMLKGWESAEETFQKWTSRGNLPDFKASKRVDINTFPALAKVEQGAEYKYVTTADRGETIQLATYGSLFSITRHAIINDDLMAFTRVPEKMGRAAIRTVGNLVYAILTGNPNMSDGVALFHANHANLLTGAAISTASVDLAAAAMARQTDPTGTTLNINLAYLIVPRTLKGLALTVATSEQEITAGKTATTPNWMRNTFEVIADPRLDSTSTSNWFGAASPVTNDTIEVAYLDGNDQPQLEQQGGWTVDGVEFKVRIDAGVKALDHRGLVKNPV
jgi:ATP-dependent protease ClpP protease subunit